MTPSSHGHWARARSPEFRRHRPFAGPRPRAGQYPTLRPQGRWPSPTLAPLREPAMTDPGAHHHLEIKEGEQTVAAADVTIPPETGIAQASLRAAAGQIPPGRRASLVDAVMDLPDVQDSDRLEAALPLGDAEILARLRERSENSTTRAAGASALLDADIPRPEIPGAETPGAGPGPPR